jgi:hypothetical protein
MISFLDNPHRMKDEGSTDSIHNLKKKLDELEREIRLLQGPKNDPKETMVEIQGGFFETMQTLRSLYLDQEEDQKRIMKISKDIEAGNIQFDLTELFFRFFIRQEIQNSRMKLLLLSQKFDMDTSLFDQLDDLSVIIDDPRYGIHQVVIGWKRFERNVTAELKRLQTK